MSRLSDVISMKNAPHLGLARKYRPQTFEDLVGQDAIATTLRNAIESGQTAHAYLFFGPRGVGKTTTARIVAKSFNCKSGPTPKPCLKCSSCEEIAAGTAIDVLELDAASNTQVDKIREMIIETVSLAPSRDRSKVFIIDEAHMLSMSSFNALLKTLEEPPPHVVFILATTELAKLPATIVSRCQRFRFRPIPRTVLSAHLERLAKLEKIEIEPAAIDLLARAAAGGLRDAVSLLDQAAAYADGPVTAAKVAELMGTLPEELLGGMVGAILAKNARDLSTWIGRAAEEGYDSGQLLRDLRERLERMYLFRLGVGEALKGKWAQWATPHSPETFSFLIQRINRTLEELRTTDSPQIAFELGLYGMLESAYDLGDLVERLEELERRLSSGTPPASPSAESGVFAKARPVGGQGEELPARSSAASTQSAIGAAPPAPACANSPQRAWAAALVRLRETKPSLAVCLEESRLEPVEEGPWKLSFRQTFNRDRAKTGASAIEAEISASAGHPVRLSFELGEKSEQERKAGSAPEEGWIDASSSENSVDPGVQKVLGVFGGKVRRPAKPPKP